MIIVWNHMVVFQVQHKNLLLRPILSYLIYLANLIVSWDILFFSQECYFSNVITIKICRFSLIVVYSDKLSSFSMFINWEWCFQLHCRSRIFAVYLTFWRSNSCYKTLSSPRSSRISAWLQNSVHDLNHEIVKNDFEKEHR